METHGTYIFLSKVKDSEAEIPNLSTLTTNFAIAKQKITYLLSTIRLTHSCSTLME